MINSVVLVDSLTLWLGVCYFVVQFGICFDLRCFACWCMYCLVLDYGGNIACYSVLAVVD